MNDSDSIPLWLLFMTPLFLVGLVIEVIAVTTMIGGRSIVIFLTGCGLSIILIILNRRKLRTNE